MRSLKTLKWNFDVPRKEFVEQLRTQMETASFNKTLITQMFHYDFKMHIVALALASLTQSDQGDHRVQRGHRQQSGPHTPLAVAHILRDQSDCDAQGDRVHACAVLNAGQKWSSPEIL